MVYGSSDTGITLYRVAGGPPLFLWQFYGRAAPMTIEMFRDKMSLPYERRFLMKECIKCPNCNYIMEKILYHEYIDGLDDFIDDCMVEYGVRIPERYEVMEAISNTDFYYDRIMDKIYKNKSVYYEEFDD